MKGLIDSLDRMDRHTENHVAVSLGDTELKSCCITKRTDTHRCERLRHGERTVVDKIEELILLENETCNLRPGIGSSDIDAIA